MISLIGFAQHIFAKKFLLLNLALLVQVIHVGNLNPYRIHTVVSRKSMVLHISKNSPPIAALEDAKLSLGTSENTSRIELKPVLEFARLLPGMKISRREILHNELFGSVATIQPAVSRPEIDQGNPEKPVAKNTSIVRLPRIINFQQLMEKIKNGSGRDTQSTSEASGQEPMASTEKNFDPLSINPQQATLGMVESKKRETKASSDPGINESESDPKATPRDYKISGTLELADVAFQPDQKLVVYREVNGRELNFQVIAPSPASFVMQTDRLTGFLVAELRDQSDSVLARDEKWLDRLDRRGQRHFEVHLKLKPTAPFSTYGRTHSGPGDSIFHQAEGQVSVMAAQQWQSQSVESGAFEIAGFLPGSTFVVRSEKKAHMGTMAFGTSRQSLPLKVFSNNLVDGLFEIASVQWGLEKNEVKDYGIVWGRVDSRQPSLEGYKVEIVDEDCIGPIYFNDYFLPDNKLKSTSRNGLFAFLKVKQGLVVVRATLDGRSLPSRYTLSDPNFISVVQIETPEKQMSTMKSFDAFTKVPVTAELAFKGSAKTALTNDMGIIRTGYAKNSDPLIMDSEAGQDYLPIRFHDSRIKSELSVPQFRISWFYSLKLNLDPNKGIVIGLVEDQKFDVFMDINGRPHNDIYYFDGQGVLVPVPVRGGGFIIANVPHGVREVSIVPEGSPAIFTQVVVIDYETPAAVFVNLNSVNAKIQ